MGLFDLFKKKKDDNMEPIDGIPPSTWLPTPPPVYDYDRTRQPSTTKAKQSEVIKKIENAKDMQTIAKVLVENNLISTPKDEQHNTFGDDLRHLTPEGELPWGWIAHNQSFVDRQEKRINNKWNVVVNSTSTADKLEAYRKYFETVNQVGEVCKKTGECHYKWFCEHIIGSVWYNNQLEKYERLKKKA